MTEKQNKKTNSRAICIVIAILILLIGIAITAYCYFWNHAQYDPLTDSMTEFQHGIEYEYYAAAIVALPTCLLSATILIAFSGSMKRLFKIIAIIVAITIVIVLVMYSCSSGGTGDYSGGGGTVTCPNCGTGFRSGHPAASFVKSHGYCSSCGGR